MKGKDNTELSAVYIALAIAIVLRAWGRFKIDSSIADRIKKTSRRRR